MISNGDIKGLREGGGGDISHASNTMAGGEVCFRLTRDGVVTLPVHASHETKPKLGPRAGHYSPTFPLNELAPVPNPFVVLIPAQ